MTGTADDRTPGHYHGDGALQPWDIVDAFGLDYYCGSAVEYICRHERKGGAEDLRKARHYLDAAIARYRTPPGTP